MTCSTSVCGTGGWTGPLSGDPDNNSILSAVAAFGGIDVSWTFPTLNPYAVAHTILYRGTSANFELATRRAVVDGSFFYDKINEAVPVTYYYWIQIVSINGTYGDVIGPASAMPRTMIGDVIADLTGRIDAGVLAQSLKTDIDRITTQGADLVSEIQNRIAADDLLGVALQQVQSETSAAMSFVADEIIQRTTADDAFVQQLNTLVATVNDNAAAIQNEQTLRVDQGTALASDITLLYSRVGDAEAAILSVGTASTAADAALASQIDTVQSTLNSDIASVQTSLQTNINTLDGEITSIGALYTAKVAVNGLIGGFGVYNDGTEVQAGFDVDTFWIGRTNEEKVKPFIYSAGQFFFNGPVMFSNIQGAGDLAALDSVSYSAITGTKPPTNADNTGSNTAYDTARVGGTTASTVRDNAAAGATAATKVNDWVRPATTLIDGNKIYTGDAYVDTLQIQGDAVTSVAYAYGVGYAAVTLSAGDDGLAYVAVGSSSNAASSSSVVRVGVTGSTSAMGVAAYGNACVMYGGYIPANTSKTIFCSVDSGSGETMITVTGRMR